MTTEELHALVKAWDEGEPGAGAALYDAMEEAGWPWKWERDGPSHILHFPGLDKSGQFAACSGAPYNHTWGIWIPPSSCTLKKYWKDDANWPDEEARKRRCEEALKKYLRES